MKLNFKKQSKFTSNLMKVLGIFVLTIILNSSFLIFNSYSAPDNELTYHGKLTDNNDIAVPDTNYDFKLTIYDAATGGNCLWTSRGTCGTPTAKSVPVTNGIFNITLGEVGDNSLDSITFDSNYYLGVTIGTNSEMTPRRKITPTGFALNSQRLGGFAADSYIDTTSNQTKTGTLDINNDFTVNTNDFHVDTTNGRVGIGTSSPNTKLHVIGDGAIARLSSADYIVGQIESRGTGVDYDKGLLRLFDTGIAKVYLDSAGYSYLNGGNVGIGTTTPNGQLEIATNANNSILRISSTATDSYPSVRFTNDAQEWRIYGADGSQNDKFVVYDGTNSITKFSIEGQSDGGDIYMNGNVGIGTLNPVYKLQVAGHIVPDVDDTYNLGTSSLRWQDVYVGPASLHIGTDGDEGIISYNTTNDAFEFNQAAVFGNATNPVAGMVRWSGSDLQGYDGTTWDSLTAAGVWTQSGGDIYRTGGSIGIGTTTPNATLDVKGNTALNVPSDFWASSADNYYGFHTPYGYLGSNGAYAVSLFSNGYRNSSGGFTSLGIDGNTTASGIELRPTGDIQFRTGTPSGTTVPERMTIDSDGNVGIGTTNPGAKLDIAGTGDGTTLLKFSTERPWKFMQASTGAAAALELNSNVGAKTFKITSLDRSSVAEFFASDTDSSVEVLLAPDGGNVGIGINNPTTKLDVAGTIRTNDQFVSTLATGTSPLSVASTTLNTNLNADLLDNQEGSYYTNASNINAGTLAVVNGGTGATTLNDLITLGTHTTGNYVANVTGNSQIVVGGTAAEGWTPTLSIAGDSIGDAQLQYDTGQHLTTSSSPTFNNIYASGRVYVDNTTNYLSYPTGDYGSIQINGGGAGGWEGYSIDGRYAMMSNDTGTVGLYNDVDNRWISLYERNSYYRIYEPDSGTVAMEVNAAGDVSFGGSLAVTLGRGDGNVSNGSDILFNASGSIAAQNSIYFNIDSDSTNSGENFIFQRNGETSAAQDIMWIREGAVNTPIIYSQASNADANSTLESMGAYRYSLGIYADQLYQYYTDSSNVSRRIITTGSAQDLAEWYKVGDDNLDSDGNSTLQKGEVLCIDPNDKRKLIACDNEYDKTIAGIVSTQAYTTMGMNDLDDDHHDAVELGLVGQVPTVVTTKNGVITAGDIVTSSNISGVGMRATHKGFVVGSSLETSENWDSDTCENISNVEDIDWPFDDGTNTNNPCFELPDGTFVGKLMVFIKPVWWNGEEEIVEYEDMLALQAEANQSANLIEGLRVDVDEIESNQQTLISTVSTNSDTVLAINENILFTTDADNNKIVTLDGITVVDNLKANTIETNTLTVNDNITTEDANGDEINASSIGTAIIVAGETEIEVVTESIKDGGRVFVTSVSDMAGTTFYVEKDYENNLFKIIMEKVSDLDVSFDWFVVN